MERWVLHECDYNLVQRQLCKFHNACLLTQHRLELSLYNEPVSYTESNAYWCVNIKERNQIHIVHAFINCLLEVMSMHNIKKCFILA